MPFEKILLVNMPESVMNSQYWDRLHSLAKKTVSLPKDSPDILKEIADTDCLLVGFATPITKEHMDVAENLKYIGTLAIAYHKIDTAYARERSIPVTNIAGYCTESVAEFVIAAILNEIRQLDEGKRRSIAENYNFVGMSATEIRGRVFGVFGLGNIGKRTAELAKGFGADVRYWSRNRKEDCEAMGIRYEDKDALLQDSDFISINFAHTPETNRFFDEAALSRIKRGAIVVNTVPMETVDITALEKRLAKVDMTFIFDHSDEMRQEDIEKLSKYKNCIVYPPIAFISIEARKNKQELFIGNIENFLNGRPTNVVN